MILLIELNVKKKKKKITSSQVKMRFSGIPLLVSANLKLLWPKAL